MLDLRRLPFIGSLLLAVALAACTTPVPDTMTRNPVGFSQPDAIERPSNNANYVIGALDTVTMTVFQVQDLSGDFQVDPTGRLNLPLVGAVDAQGKTLTQLQSELKALYGSKYLRDPDLRLEMKTAVSQRVTVDGAVTQPGLYPVSGDMTLIQAIATARGMTQDANPTRVVIFRKISGQRQAASFDVKAIRRGELADPQIYGNDIIVVDGSKSRQTFRDIMSSIPLLSIFRPF